MEVETYFLLNGRQTILKDPGEVLDYAIDLTDWLALVTDTIGSVTWTNSSGITKDSQSNTTTRAVAWFSGGTDKSLEWATARIVTAGGRTVERTIYFQMKQR
jgi:hypothetical protein